VYDRIGAQYRRGRQEDPRIAALALIPDGDRADGMRHLEADLDSGQWHRRWGHLLALDELDLGYRVVAAQP
jgi:hypothetical protein